MCLFHDSSICTATPLLPLNHLPQVEHCRTSCCWYTGFILSSMHLRMSCHILLHMEGPVAQCTCTLDKTALE